MKIRLVLWRSEDLFEVKWNRIFPTPHDLLVANCGKRCWVRWSVQVSIAWFPSRPLQSGPQVPQWRTGWKQNVVENGSSFGYYTILYFDNLFSSEAGPLWCGLLWVIFTQMKSNIIHGKFHDKSCKPCEWNNLVIWEIWEVWLMNLDATGLAQASSFWFSGNAQEKNQGGSWEVFIASWLSASLPPGICAMGQANFPRANDWTSAWYFLWSQDARRLAWCCPWWCWLRRWSGSAV